ncbi:hypothetical protein [Limosilactobacillus antri]|uniref:hypothetical protein n=1 Tax=Limosilactobacillus antri TaxID=227943 RepID=UPI001F5A7A78|nr:hypothetical protein [Limosilactobacillus antri]
MKQEERYIQPQSTQEALLLIQKLFNSYRNAPLTQELLDYHNNLIFRLGSDIHEAAVKEGKRGQLDDLANLSAAMRRWTAIRLSGRPFPFKLRHFKLVSEQTPKFKRRVHKIHQNSGHRASRH